MQVNSNTRSSLLVKLWSQFKAYDQASEKKSEISTHVIEGNQNLKEKIN